MVNPGPGHFTATVVMERTHEKCEQEKGAIHRSNKTKNQQPAKKQALYYNQWKELHLTNILNELEFPVFPRKSPNISYTVLTAEKPKAPNLVAQGQKRT